MGVDDGGKVYRLRGDASLENVSDRYGLADKHVVAVVAMGEKGAAFAYDGGFAIADGTKVVTWNDPGWQSLAASDVRLAGVVNGSVRVFDTVATAFALFPTASAAEHVAFDADGRLLVANSYRLYVEEGASLSLRYKDGNIHGLVNAGKRVWFAAGGEPDPEAGVAYRSTGATLTRAQLWWRRRRATFGRWQVASRSDSPSIVATQPTSKSGKPRCSPSSRGCAASAICREATRESTCRATQPGSRTWRTSKIACSSSNRCHRQERHCPGPGSHGYRRVGRRAKDALAPRRRAARGTTHVTASAVEATRAAQRWRPEIRRGPGRRCRLRSSRPRSRAGVARASAGTSWSTFAGVCSTFPGQEVSTFSPLASLPIQVCCERRLPLGRR